MHPYLPHTEAEIDSMLDRIGVSSMEALFCDIPEDLRYRGSLDLPKPHAEGEILAAMEKLAEKNRIKILFAGCGCYDHLIPSVVRHLSGRSEFVTSYTPYQAEMSQGILQALFEFQSSMAELTGLPVANASLYDGHTAAAEACSMSLLRGRKTLLMAATLHPFTRRVLHSVFDDAGVELRVLPETRGRVSLDSVKENLNEQVAAVLVQTPNIYGILEDLSGWAEAVHSSGALFIVSANPLSLGALTPPAEWGADIAVGDTQVLGLPPSFGGPSAGYITCTMPLMRRIPGRVVGESVDSQGRRAFVLTLQAREQHIKRERALSNICTNQSLAALANTVYLAAMGPSGLAEVAERNIHGAALLRERLTDLPDLVDYSPVPVFNEFTLRVPISRQRWLLPFEEAGIFPGVFLSDLDPAFPDDVFTIAVTEKRGAEDLELYFETAKKALS